MDLGALLRVRPALRTTRELKEIKKQLGQCPFFADWADESLIQISGVLGCAIFTPGEVVTEPGEAVNSIFILLSGSCDFAVPHPTDPRIASQHRALLQGDVCGREAVLSHDPRARARVTAGPSGALLATLTGSAWADVCARAAAGSPIWVATRADLLCAFLRQLVSVAPPRRSRTAAGARWSQEQSPSHHPRQQRQGQHGGSLDACAGDKELGTDARSEPAASAVEGPAAAGAVGPGEAEGPAEALRLELMAVLLAAFPSSMAAMPQTMLREAARGCHVRTVYPYGILHGGETAPTFQAILLSGELQVRQSAVPAARRSLLLGGDATPASSQAPGTLAAKPPAALEAEQRAVVAAVGADGAAAVAPEEDSTEPAATAGPDGSNSPAGEDGGEGRVDGTKRSSNSGSNNSDDPSPGTGKESVEAEEAGHVEDEDEEDVEEDEREGVGAEPEGGEGRECSLVEGGCSKEAVLDERFGGVVTTETRGSVLMELPFAAIARRGRAARGKAAGRGAATAAAVALTAGAKPAVVLLVPLSALRRGYAVARAALVSERVALMAGCRPLAAVLSPAELSALALAARPLWLAAGAVVARQGAPVETLYLVQEGEIRLLDDPNSTAHHCHHHQPSHHHHLLLHHHRHHHHHNGADDTASGTVPPAPTDSSSGSYPSRGALSSHASALLMAALLEDPVISSEMAPRASWLLHNLHHDHGHGHGHRYSHSRGFVAGGLALMDATTSQVQRSLTHLAALMIVEPGGLLGEAVLGEEEGAGEEQHGAAAAAAGPEEEPESCQVGGSEAADDAHASPLSGGQQPPLHSPSATPRSVPTSAAPLQPPLQLSPAPPPTATASSAPLQHRPSTHRVAIGAATVTAADATASMSDPVAVQAAPAAGSDQELQQQEQQPAASEQQEADGAQEQGNADEPNGQRQQQQQGPTSVPPTPQQQQQQQQQQSREGHESHHKHMQHLHRLLVRHGKDQLTQSTNYNHHNHPAGNAAAGTTSAPVSVSNGELHAIHFHSHSHAKTRGSLEIPTVSPISPLHTSLSSPGASAATAATAATADSGGGPCRRGSTASLGPAAAGAEAQQSKAAKLDAAAGHDAAAAAAARRGVFPATAVAVGAVRLLALPREALLRLPQLQPVLAALAAGQLRILERRRREAQEVRDRLEEAAAAAGAADGACGGPRPPLTAAAAAMAAAAAARDPQAAARQRRAARRAAVGGLDGGAAAALRAPEVRPTEEMMARPSVVLERMGFKVPKLRGILVQSSSPGPSRRSPSRRASEKQQASPLAAAAAQRLRRSESSSPIPPAATAQVSFGTGEPAILSWGVRSRAKSVAIDGGGGAFGAAAAAAAAARLPALPHFSSGAKGAMLDGDMAAAITAEARGGNGGCGRPFGCDGAAGLRATVSVLEQSGSSLSGSGGGSVGKYSTPLPHLLTDELRRLCGNSSGSAFGDRVLTYGSDGGGGAAAVVAAAPPSDPRSCGGSPMRRSPRVYDMDAFAAASTRAGSFSGFSQGDLRPLRGSVRAGGGGSGFGPPSPGSDGAHRARSFTSIDTAATVSPPLLSSTGSPRVLSLSGGAVGTAAVGIPGRTASYSNVSRLLVPPAAPEDGPLNKSRRVGSCAASPVAAFVTVPPPLPASATARRIQRMSFDDGRLPALPSPQRPSRMFQEEAAAAAAAAAAALLRGRTAAAAAVSPRPRGNATLPPDDYEAVSKWMEQHAGSSSGGGSALLRRMLTQKPNPPAVMGPAAGAGPAVGSAGADAQVSVEMLRRASATSRRGA